MKAEDTANAYVPFLSEEEIEALREEQRKWVVYLSEYRAAQARRKRQERAKLVGAFITAGLVLLAAIGAWIGP